MYENAFLEQIQHGRASDSQSSGQYPRQVSYSFVSLLPGYMMVLNVFLCDPFAHDWSGIAFHFFKKTNNAIGSQKHFLVDFS